MSNINNVVNGLWIGEKLSALELLCLKSFTANGYIFHLWSYNEIENIPIGIIKKDGSEIISSDEIFSYQYKNKFGHGKGSYAGFSDIFRYRLLFLKGGIWTDMDVTCLKPFEIKESYLFRYNYQIGVVGNIIKTPQGSPIMEYCYLRAKKEINPNNQDWMLPIRILDEGIKKHKLENYIYQISNEDNFSFVSNMLVGKIIIPNEWIFIHWMNEEWRRYKLEKNKFIYDSNIQILMDEYKIEHTHFSFIETFYVKLKLSSFVSDFINFKNYLSLTIKQKLNFMPKISKISDK